MATFIIDGERITVQSANELVEYMHRTSRTPAADDKAYMMDVSDRMILQSGGKIRTDSHEAFVNDLTRHGFIEHIPEVRVVHWWVRYEDGDGDYKDDGPFLTKEDAEKYANERGVIPYIVVNDDDRAASTV